MIYKIANLLRDQISTLNYVDVAVGLARPTVVRLKTGDAEEPEMLDKVVPMAVNDVVDPCVGGDLLQLVPDTSKLSIHWWEDLGVALDREETYYIHARANLKLISWWNLPLINSSYESAEPLVAHLVSTIPDSLANTDYLTQMRVTFNGQEISGAQVVQNYNFGVEENQFTTYPYQFTGLLYIVDFAFAKNCVDEIILNPSACP